MGWIVALFRLVRAEGRQFIATGVQGQPLSIFKVLRLDKVFRLQESTLDAKRRTDAAIQPRHPLEKRLEQVSEALRKAKERNRPGWALVGAGCSVSAGIPDAAGFAQYIACAYPSHLSPTAADEPALTYETAMGALPPGDRRDVVKKLMTNATLNPTYLLLAWLMKQGYLSRVLTPNFDDLLLRACALFGIFPAVYDLTGTGLVTEGLLREPAIIHLHGQHAGIAQMHTRADYRRIKSQVQQLLLPAAPKQPVLVSGYSGNNDPLFEILHRVDSFAYGLYWTTYRNQDPDARVLALLRASEGGYFVRSVDSDLLFYRIAAELGLDVAWLVIEPFSTTRAQLERVFSALPPEADESMERVRVAAKSWLAAMPVELRATRESSERETAHFHGTTAEADAPPE